MLEKERNPNPAKAQGLGFRIYNVYTQFVAKCLRLSLSFQKSSTHHPNLEKKGERTLITLCWKGMKEKRCGTLEKEETLILGKISTPNLLQGASLSLSTYFVSVDRECLVLWRKPRSRLLLLWFDVNSGTYFGCGSGTLFFCGRKNPDLFCWIGLKQCGSRTQFCRTDVASSAVLAFEFKAVFLWAVSGSCWMKGEA
jgi:hypothetical protein